ncbi:MAG: ABC transporter substrate-binding protein [Janthinobacterium lividum]
MHTAVPAKWIRAASAIALLTFGALTQSAAFAETFKAGSPPTSAPMTFLDIKTNTLQGVMPDVIREIGKRQGFDVSFDAIPFSALIQSAASGKIDIIVSAMTPTPKRAQVVDFADVVYAFGEGLAVADDDKTVYKSARDLKGETIGASTGTTYGDALKAMGIFKEVKYYDTPADLLHDLQDGRIKGAFTDYPLLKALQARGGMRGAHVDDAYVPVAVTGVTIAVRKGNDALLHKIDAGIAQMKADGSLAKILAKWGLH